MNAHTVGTAFYFRGDFHTAVNSLLVKRGRKCSVLRMWMIETEGHVSIMTTVGVYSVHAKPFHSTKNK